MFVVEAVFWNCDCFLVICNVTTSHLCKYADLIIACNVFVILIRNECDTLS